MASGRTGGRKVVARNKKARHEYEILDTYEAGLALKGPEVKSLRAGKVSLAEAFARVDDGEVWLHGMHVTPYDPAARWNVDPVRPRKLLLHGSEIRRLIGATQEKGLALVLDLADRKKEIFDEDLEKMMEDFEGTSESRLSDETLSNGGSSEIAVPAYRLTHLSVQIETDEDPQVRVRLERADGSIREEEATGDGPVEAVYRAIDHAVDQPHTLVEYSIRSLSEGADAQGEVEVRIRYGENAFSGRARDTDVIRASAEAYVDALNRLAAAKSDAESVEFVQNGIINAYNGD